MCWLIKQIYLIQLVIGEVKLRKELPHMIGGKSFKILEGEVYRVPLSVLVHRYAGEIASMI